jgi:hypothetical protein
MDCSPDPRVGGQNPKSMPFRSHLGRSFDPTNRNNLLMLVVCVGLGVVALLLWLDGRDGSVFLAPVLGFLGWALLREIDPDHGWTAIGSAVAVGAWALRDGPRVSALAVAGIMLAARLVSSTTGRRPLPGDLVFVSVAGTAMAFSVEGWVAGFGIAVAIYLDDRLSGPSKGSQVLAAGLTAFGATLVATLARAFPETMPRVVPLLALLAGVVALVLVARDPAEPTTLVDARHGALLSPVRIHVSRSLVGVLVFVATLAVGTDAPALIGLIVGISLAIVSNELELARRRSR